MNVRRHAHADQTSALATGWLVSCLLHGTLAIAALLFVQRLQLVPQPKSFQWDVAMVGTLAPSTATPPPQPATSSAPPVQEVTPSQVVTRSGSVQPSPSNTAPPHTAEPTYQESQLPPAPPDSAQISQQSESLASTVREPVSSPSAIPPPQIAPETVAEPVPASELLASPQASLAPSQGQSMLSRTELTDLMIKWSEDLDKHYPALPRTEGIQGKVTVVAMLHSNGVFSDIRVAKSSGNALLDQAAVEDVKNGPPIKFPRPLERPSMLVKLPIVYMLSDRR